MTLVFTVIGRNNIWLVADRRISYFDGRAAVDDAVKVARFETTDGVALLAYAGLGETALGMQPSEWMSAALRGRAGLSLEQGLGVLAAVAARELPHHLNMPAVDAHVIVAPAFIRDRGPQMYTIHTAVSGSESHFCFESQRSSDSGDRCTRMLVMGSGAAVIARWGKAWVRSMYSLIGAHDRGKISNEAVAGVLASASFAVSAKSRTVGRGSIVIRCGRPPLHGGGEHYIFDGSVQLPDSVSIPTIANGFDVSSISAVLMDDFLRRSEPMGRGEQPLAVDGAAINTALANRPHEPDERLR